MTAQQYEKAFLVVAGIVLVVFLGALGVSAYGMGIHVQSREGEIDPSEVRSTAPFDDPGVRKVGPNAYEVVMIGQVWRWVPDEVRVPAGAKVTFRMTSPDVIHGLKVRGTAINAMVVPGQITVETHTFEEPGEHIFLCHEYCGVQHHTMYGKVVVEPREESASATDRHSTSDGSEG